MWPITDPEHWGKSSKQIRKGFYKHFKGGIYFVEGLAKQSTNGQPDEIFVVYHSVDGCNDDGMMRIRLLKEFMEDVPIEENRDPKLPFFVTPRFTRIDTKP